MSVQRPETDEPGAPGALARAVEPSTAGFDEPARPERPRGLRSGWVVVRLLGILGFLCVAAVLIVEGILLGQVGTFNEERPLIGRVIDIQRSEATSVVTFDFVTRQGLDMQASCEIDNGSLEQSFRTPGAPMPAARPGRTMAPGQTLEVLHRRGVLGVYACSREGLASLHAAGTRIMRWGLLFGAFSLAMLAWFIGDLWRYTRSLPPRDLEQVALRGSLDP